MESKKNYFWRLIVQSKNLHGLVIVPYCAKISLFSRREDHILETECIRRPADTADDIYVPWVGTSVKCPYWRVTNPWIGYTRGGNHQWAVVESPCQPMCGRPKWQGSWHVPFKGCLALKNGKIMENHGKSPMFDSWAAFKPHQPTGLDHHRSRCEMKFRRLKHSVPWSEHVAILKINI